MPDPFFIVQKDVKEYAKDLKAFTKKAYPIAVKETLNATAFDGMRQAKSIIDADMIQRNTFTKRSIRVEKVKSTKNPRNMFSVLGSTEDYMKDQELGAVKVKKGKHGVPIPTSEAANQGDANPRTKVVAKRNKLGSIRLGKRNKTGKSRGQRNLLTIKQAQKDKKRFVFIDLGRKKGIFKLKGPKKNLEVRMISDLSENTVKIPKSPWLEPAHEGAIIAMPNYYKQAVIKQVKFHKLFNK